MKHTYLLLIMIAIFTCLTLILFVAYEFSIKNYLVSTSNIIQKGPNNPLPTVALADTRGWKTYISPRSEIYYNWYTHPVTVIYPPSWSLTVLHQSGSPNFVLLSAPDGTSCIKISLGSDYSSRVQNNELSALDSFSQAFAIVNNALTPNSITNAPATEIDGTQKVERSLIVNGKSFMVGLAYLAFDPPKYGGNLSAGLSSCSMNEKTIFTTVLKNITVQ